MSKDYLRFYWPLTLMGVSMLLARQFQNGVLARYPDATREIAIFAIAISVVFVFNSLLIFVPQMTNVFARSRQGLKVSLLFTVQAAFLLGGLLAVLAFSPLGELVLRTVFGLQPQNLDGVVRYLQYLWPLVIINALRGYAQGLLIQNKNTGLVTVLNIGFLTTSIGILLLGLKLGWAPQLTIAGSALGGAAVELVAGWIAVSRVFRFHPEGAEGPVRWLDVFIFFWPIALTSWMFSMSRPIIFSFVARLPEPEPVIAALRVAFDLSLIFMNPVNQFRHLFVTFGSSDRKGIRRFMIQVMLILVGLILFMVATPLVNWVLAGLMEVPQDVVQLARWAFLIAVLNPILLTLRNYYHGLAMVERKTGKMGVGGLLRVGAIYATCWIAFHLGILNHITAALALSAGFGAEALSVLYLTRRQAQAA